MLENKIIGYVDNGVYVITAPKGRISNDKDWPIDVPSFEGGDYNGVYAGGDGSIIVCINNAHKSDIEKYIKKLIDSGYTRLYKNTINNNDFYTFSNNINLIYFYLIENSNKIKVIAEPYYEYTTYTKEKNIVAPAIIASSVCDRNFYVRLPDNSLVVIDGGWRIEDWCRIDHFEFMEKMYDEMIEIIGGCDKIHIPLWIITHPHNDHVRVLETLYKTNIKEKFVIERILYNFPAKNHIFEFSKPTSEQLKEMDANIKRWHNEAGTTIPYERIFYNCPFRVYDMPDYDLECRKFFNNYDAVQIKAHDGMKFELSGVEFEVLHTPDDDMPTIFKVINDTSIIVKMTYKNSSMLWLGDMGPLPSESCVNMYGHALKCDAMQVAHHGWGAATPEFYEMTKPSVLFWNNSEFGFKYADKNQGFGKTKTSTDLYNMDCVKKNIFCNRIRPTYAYLPIKHTNFEKFIDNDCVICASAVSDRIIMMKLPNGKLIVFDGGWRKEDWDNYDRSKLMKEFYQEMCELAGNDKVTVAMWAISNIHTHNNRFLENLDKMEFANDIIIEKIIYSFSDKTDLLDLDTIPQNYKNDLMRAFKNTKAELYEAQTGLHFSLETVSFDVLYKSNNNDIETISDTTAIYRVQCKGATFIYTGEMTNRISQKLLTIYNEDLKCDVVQVANHGWNNCGVLEFYEKCGAKLQIWNNSEYGYQFFRKDEGYKKTEVSTRVYNLPSCVLNVFCNQAKPQHFSLPLKDEQLKYDVF